MYAYRLPLAAVPMEAAEHESARRLLPAGTWQFSPHPQGGTLATLKRADGRAPALDEFGEPRETADGLLYYPSREPLTVDALRRQIIPPAIPVELACGLKLPVPIAAASARKLVFTAGSMTTGDYLTAYAQMAEELRGLAKRDGDLFTDRDEHFRLMGRVVLAAIQQVMTATEEALTDLGILSTDDFLPIVLASWGYDPDPNAGGAGAGPSPSPAPASPTSP